MRTLFSAGRSSAHVEVLGGADGFTLLEMMVVIVLLALAAAALSMSTARGLAAAHADKACSDTASLLRATRIQAMETGTTQRLDIDPSAHLLRDFRGRMHALPLDLAVSVFGADALSSAHVTGIAFAADGSSSGGHISLLRQRMRCRIDVSWLTGATEIDKRIVADSDSDLTGGLNRSDSPATNASIDSGANFPGNAPGTP